MAINMVLAEFQGLTETDHKHLQVLYNNLDALMTSPEDFSDPVGMIEVIEYNLQKVWKFPQNKDFHKYWFRIKGCTCPKSDNRTYIGTEYRLMNTNCPWHNPGAVNVEAT